MTTNCPVCSSLVNEYKREQSLEPWFRCPICGDYELNYLTLRSLEKLDSSLKPKLCSKIYYHNLYHQSSCFIELEDLENLKTENTSPAQILNRLIEFLYEKKHQLDSFLLRDHFLFPILQSSNLKIQKEYFKELENQAIIKSFKTLTNYDDVKISTDYDEFTPELSSSSFECFEGVLTLKGFEVYEELKKGKSKSNQVFMALQFGTQADEFYNTHLKPAVSAFEQLELKDIRQKNQAGMINIHMEAEIRQSKFLIADVTPVEGKPNANVYWEAGFAQGLGKKVIYLCEKEAFDILKNSGKVPFDVRNHYHLVYDLQDPEASKAILQDVIYNTFPNELVHPDNKEKP